MRPVELPVIRELATLRGELADLLAGYEEFREHYLAFELTDLDRPTDPMRRLLGRYPHAMKLDWRPPGLESGGPRYPATHTPVDDAALIAEFLTDLRGNGPSSVRSCPDRPGALDSGPRGSGGVKLHWLEVSAFGPYPESVRIDFDVLAADGLFLLHGDTGAGKTSLLDAVAFALFGTVPGARQEANRLRSDSAAAHAETRVTLEVTVGGQRLRLSRTPQIRTCQVAGERHDRRAGHGDAELGRPSTAGAGGRRHRPDSRGRTDRHRAARHERRPVLPGRATAAGRVRPIPAGAHGRA